MVRAGVVGVNTSDAESVIDGYSLECRVDSMVEDRESLPSVQPLPHGFVGPGWAPNPLTDDESDGYLYGRGARKIIDRHAPRDSSDATRYL